MIQKAIDTNTAAPVFTGWEETLIWACLQGTMGAIYVDDTDRPLSAMAVLGDFCFFAGKPKEELVSYKPEQCMQDFIIMVPENDAWAELIERCYKDKAKKVSRYAIKKEPEIFDTQLLEQAVALLPEGYNLKMMDEELFYQCRAERWSGDLVSQFTEYEGYAEHGLGVLILKDGVPVSGASSYAYYNGGIEIEIDTREDYRRKGLAYICGAKLILECLERNLYPSWDAQNKWSVALAEKLGYHYSHTYTAYEIWGY